MTGATCRTLTADSTLRAPRQTANSARRRALRELVLLQSPAQPSHYNHIEQIFLDAGRIIPVSQHHEDEALYPQLPNMSKQTTPLRAQQRENIAPTRVRQLPTQRRDRADAQRSFALQYRSRQQHSSHSRKLADQDQSTVYSEIVYS